MLFSAFEHVVVRCGFLFVIVRLDVILAHRIIHELVPHQNSPQVGMTFEVDAVEIEDLALLKFGASPDRGERRQCTPSARFAVRMRIITGPCLCVIE